MKYFVTGATGFIGGRLARELVRRGHQVVAVVRTPAKATDLAALGVEIHQGDITDKESMRAPMTGVDGVFHIAAWYKIGARDHSMAEAINVGGTRNVLELMLELGISKGVYTSTLGVFSDTHGQIVDESYRLNTPANLSEYERTKWLAHYEVALPMIQQGLPLVIVQPGAVYGPGDTSVIGATLQQYLQGKLPMLPEKMTFAWAHVDDIVAGHILALEQGRVGESYIICGEVRTVVEFYQLAEKLSGIPAPRLRASPGMLRASARLMDVVGRVITLPALFSGEGLRAGTATYIATNAKARRELGFDPRPLEVGLRETLAYDMQRLGIQPKPGAPMSVA